MKSIFRSRPALALLVALALSGGAAATAMGEAAEPERPATETFSISVDLSERTLYVLRGEEVVESYPVAVGKPEHPTPRGEFQIRRLVWNPRWVPPDARWARGKKPEPPGSPDNPMGRVKIFFQPPDYYIHGTRNVDSLGEAESHGCIRMRNSDVIALARLVMENGGAERPASWFRQVIDRVRSTRDVRLSDPVLVKIRP